MVKYIRCVIYESDAEDFEFLNLLLSLTIFWIMKSSHRNVQVTT